MDITSALAIPASGMAAQAYRLQIIAQNMANADTTATTPGGDPYRRQVVTFSDQMNQELGLPSVAVDSVTADPTPFPLRYDPASPAANAQGYVKLPNVDPLVEMMDMQQAERAYQADLAVMQTTRTALSRTLALLQ
jgi:flagellar basal-body rod protein FlgC